ncbi:hypothetical protein DC31_15100 [Microbacterium sp. CH12i]|uniref:hypothetical protein n=1 Tax=Microbacterium sp. CH12i TaxID=1479651 RepID=UPI00046115B4|nr:hypothetical protein [Microbacterium sp. CH12i]KDA05880.1 hypothetical protein DC31_15100 [Microbacterium sp. CH12i]
MDSDDRMPTASVFASVDVDADDARQWIADRLHGQAERDDPVALSVEQRGDLALLLSGTWWEAIFEQEAGDGEDPRDMLKRALPAVVRAASWLPSGGLVLALYLRNLVNSAWALTWDHEILAAAIRISCAEAAKTRQNRDDCLSRLGWRLLEFLLLEFRVETALLSGRLDTVTRAADDAVHAATDIVEALISLDNEPDDAHAARGRTVLVREATNELVYYRTVRDGARLAQRMFEGRVPDAEAELARLHADISRTPFNPVDGSELRGHLTAIGAVCAARDRDRVHIDEGRVRFVFPFGVHSRHHKTHQNITESLLQAVEGRRARRETLGGISIANVRRRLDLSDVWQGTDNFGRGYRGATVELADIHVEHPHLDLAAQIVRTRIQLSHLGNNAIIFEIDLADTPAHRVAETIHLATPAFGDLHEISDLLRMHCAGKTLSGIPQVVEAILDDIRGATADAAFAAREGSFGVITTVLAASRIGSDTRTPLTSADELLDLWGNQPLIHPLPSGAASIADWTMYDVDAISTWSLLHLNNEVLASNSNVSLLASLGSPDFAVQDIESFLQFAHSMHGMYQGWQDTIRYYAEEIAQLLRDAEILLSRSDLTAEAAETRTGAINELNELVGRVERTELSLQSFVQSNEAIMLFIESPTIVTSPPLRVDLDTVLTSNGYARLRDGFTRAVRDVLGTRLQPLLEVVHRRMAQTFAAEQEVRAREQREYEVELERKRDDRERRNARFLELLGAVFTVVGLAGLASVLQAGHPEWGAGEAWVLFAAVLGLACLTGILLATVTRSNRSEGRRKWRKRDRPE